MLKDFGLSVYKEIEFADHYAYTNNDIKQIIEDANKMDCKIITTEKDYLRLENNNTDQIKFIKSELKIIDEQKLINTILN